MLQGATDKGTQPYRIWSEFADNPGHAIDHLQIQGNEKESVIVLPFVEMGVNHVGVTVEGFCEETLFLGRAQCVLLEELIFVHDTDFF
jgi:hypothetical protein